MTIQVTCYVFRHFYMTQPFKAGNDIRTVAELLGNKYIQTTQIYSHVSLSKKRDAIGKAFK